MAPPARLHWIAWQPTPYNNHLFEALTESGIDLHVDFICPVVQSHPLAVEPLRYRAEFFRASRGFDQRVIARASRDSSTMYIVAGWHNPTMQAVLTARALRRMPFGIWTDTPDMRPRSRVKGSLRARWLRWLFRRADVVFGTGTPAMRALSAMGCPPDQLASLPFFVPLRPLAANRAASPLLFVSAGRLLNEMKGYDLALTALARAREATGIEDFSYVIAGAGPDEGDLRRRVAAEGLADKVSFVGWQQPAAMSELLMRAHVLLHPSRFDPFPVAVLEAMAAGVVVLGSDACGSVEERIRDGANGFVHSAGDVVKLTDDIVTVLQDRQRTLDTGLAARRTAEQWPVSRGVQIVTEAVRRGPVRRPAAPA